MNQGLITSHQILMIITGTVIGTFARTITLKEDYRQYPSYPNGYLIHLVIGFIAAALGAVAIPALVTKNFVAVTFLALAIQQFREVRKMEATSLANLEQTEFTKRGAAYIDGISKTFEARNYVALLVSFSTSLTMQFFNKLWLVLDMGIGIAVGLTVLYLLHRLSKGKTVGDIADVKEAKITMKNDELYVDDIYVTNLVGLERGQQLVSEEGLAVIIYPREERFRIMLDNFGQRQAILFDAARSLGVKRYSFTRKDYQKGRLVIMIVPIEGEIERMIRTVKNTPLLEAIRKTPHVMDTNLAGRE
ncbi:YIEGIA family protein [Metallumcola ferriviriculae]|uniref:YIEGIA family protein n=1 Tax=Metallumcola ferriviriculae TaxID=3039180 RepID=A0AAU0UL74_9FIRM|nr:YIEGIA family protein [Desulfitibacteraceae bacterium MK1]